MNNWRTKKLGEIIIENKKSPLKSKGNKEGIYPFFVSGFNIKTADKYLIDDLSIFLPTGGNFFVHYFDGKAAYSTDTWAIKTSKEVDIKYFYYFLILNQEFIGKKLFKGATIKHLQKNDFREIEIPLPPLPEQRRIVKILDEVFEKMAKAKENAEKNLQNVKELFESYSNSVFSDKNNKWDKKKLDEICIVQRGSSPRPIKNYITNNSDGVNWIKIGDTKNINRYLFSTKQKITKEGAEKSRFVQEGDLILSNSMSFGKPFIMKTTGYIHDGWFVLRPNNNINTEYFYDVISSPQVQKQFISLASGAIVKNISGDLTKKAILPIPSILEQKSIVAKLDALSAETKKLEAIYRKKLEDLEELKKSVLKKAFSGKLQGSGFPPARE